MVFGAKLTPKLSHQFFPKTNVFGVLFKWLRAVGSEPALTSSPGGTAPASKPDSPPGVSAPPNSMALNRSIPSVNCDSRWSIPGPLFLQFGDPKSGSGGTPPGLSLGLHLTPSRARSGSLQGSIWGRFGSLQRSLWARFRHLGSLSPAVTFRRRYISAHSSEPPNSTLATIHRRKHRFRHFAPTILPSWGFDV